MVQSQTQPHWKDLGKPAAQLPARSRISTESTLGAQGWVQAGPERAQLWAESNWARFYFTAEIRTADYIWEL